MIAQEIWEKATAFHGHACPGLAVGVRAALYAARLLGGGRAADEELVCVTENDTCAVDAIQVILGCTLGKGNLLYHNSGKMAFNFYHRRSGRSVRLLAKAFPEEMTREARQRYLLEAPDEQLFSVGEPRLPLPEPARLFPTVTCAQCGEGAPEHKMRLRDGKPVCPDCWEDYSRGW